MIDYIKIGAMALTAVSIIYTLVRWRYGSGLMSRLVALIMPAIGLLGIVAFSIGRQGVALKTVGIAVPLVGLVMFLMIQVIYRWVVYRIQSHADSITSIISGLDDISKAVARQAEEQAASVAQVSSAVEQILRMSHRAMEHATEVVTSTEAAVVHGQRGIDSVQEVISLMAQLAETIRFIDVVKEVSEQSNILAINAGIEAAKAGELGAGFSVVAAEVRHFSSRIKDAAKQIHAVVRQNEKGNRAILNTNALILELGQVLDGSSDKARKISGATMQQSSGIQQIAEAMTELRVGGQQTAETSLKIEQTVEHLERVNASLAQLIDGTHRPPHGATAI